MVACATQGICPRDAGTGTPGGVCMETTAASLTQRRPHLPRHLPRSQCAATGALGHVAMGQPADSGGVKL